MNAARGRPGWVTTSDTTLANRRWARLGARPDNTSPSSSPAPTRVPAATAAATSRPATITKSCEPGVRSARPRSP